MKETERLKMELKESQKKIAELENKLGWITIGKQTLNEEHQGVIL